MRSILLDICRVSVFLHGRVDRLANLRMVKPEEWIKGSKFVQRHVTMPVSFTGTSHDMEVIVKAFEGVLLV